MSSGINPIISAWMDSRDAAIKIIENQKDRQIRQQQLQQQQQQFEQRLQLDKLAQDAEMKMRDTQRAAARLQAAKLMAEGVLQPTRREFSMEQGDINENINRISSGQMPVSTGAVYEDPILGEVRGSTPEQYGEALSQTKGRLSNIATQGRMLIEQARLREQANNAQNLERLRQQGRAENREDTQAFSNEQLEKRLKMQREVALIHAASSGRNTDKLTNAQLVTNFRTMANQFSNDPDVKEYDIIRNRYNAITSLRNDNSGYANLAMATHFSKMIDSMTGVRQAEIQNIQEARAFRNKLSNITNKFTTGAIFTPEDRAELVRLSRQFHDVSKRAYDKKSLKLKTMLHATGTPDNVIKSVIDPEGYAKDAGLSSDMVDFSKAVGR